MPITSFSLFLEAATAKYGDLYTYFPTDIFRHDKKIEFTCSKHGRLAQTPKLHLSIGCPKCSLERYSSKRINNSFLILKRKACEIYGDKYKYISYDGRRVTIECPKHGIFYKQPSLFLNGEDCPSCRGLNSESRNRKCAEEFKEKARAVHGDKYGYDKVNYISSHKKVEIQCRKHGSFWQAVTNHLKNHGCPFCSGRKLHIGSIESEIKEFYGEDSVLLNPTEITKFNSILKIRTHKKEINIQLKVFRSQQTNKIRSQSSDYKLKSSYRSRTRSLVAREKYEESSLEFLGCDPSNYKKYIDIFAANKTEKYDIDHKFPCSAFDLSDSMSIRCCFNYRNTQKIDRSDNTAKKAKILDHFSILPTKIEKILNIEDSLRLNSIEFETCFIIDNIYSDIYISSKNIAIRFYSNYECSKGALARDRAIFNLHGVELLQVLDTELIKQFDVVLSRIYAKIGLIKNKIPARKTTVVEITKTQKANFLNTNHLQKNDKSKIDLGLIYEGEIVAVMTFCKSRIALGNKSLNSEELSRFCCKTNTIVQGGANKLFKYFIRNFEFDKIVSYSEHRWGNGNVYTNLGFTKVSETVPGYYYYHLDNPLDIKHRFNFRKSMLSKRFGESIYEKEEEICKDNNYFRIYNSGNSVYEYYKN